MKASAAELEFLRKQLGLERADHNAAAQALAAAADEAAIQPLIARIERDCGLAKPSPILIQALGSPGNKETVEWIKSFLQKIRNADLSDANGDTTDEYFWLEGAFQQALDLIEEKLGTS